MNKVFSENAWRDFMAWVQEDRLIYTFDEKNIGGIADKMKSVRLA